MDRLYYHSVTVPAGTLQAAPVSSPWTFEDAALKSVTITVPDGHNGLTGIRILWSGQQIIPWSNNQYIVANDRVIPIGFDDYITASGLVIVAFNTDVFDHTFWLEAIISDLKAVRVNGNATTATSAAVPVSSQGMTDPLGLDALLASVPDVTNVIGLPDLTGA